MESSVCTYCRQPKAIYECGLCQSAVCKKCSQKVKGGSFAFMAEIPPELTHKIYCGRCYDEKFAPELAIYNRTMGRARRVFVYLKKQGEETRLIRRSVKPIQVVDCEDREETLLRLAFFAAKADFNGLVDVDIFAKKIRNAGYQTSRWQGTAVPTMVDAVKLTNEEKGIY